MVIKLRQSDVQNDIEILITYQRKNKIVEQNTRYIIKTSYLTIKNLHLTYFLVLFWFYCGILYIRLYLKDKNNRF